MPPLLGLRIVGDGLAIRLEIIAEIFPIGKQHIFRLHFQYLCAFDRPGDYDYFAITAGPRTLGDRFAGRQASPSRIETPVNRYTSVAA